MSMQAPAALGPRPDLYEIGAVPLHALVPQLDGTATLQHMHAQLLARSSTRRRSSTRAGTDRECGDAGLLGGA